MTMPNEQTGGEWKSGEVAAGDKKLSIFRRMQITETPIRSI